MYFDGSPPHSDVDIFSFKQLDTTWILRSTDLTCYFAAEMKKCTPGYVTTSVLDVITRAQCTEHTCDYIQHMSMVGCESERESIDTLQLERNSTNFTYQSLFTYVKKVLRKPFVVPEGVGKKWANLTSAVEPDHYWIFETDTMTKYQHICQLIIKRNMSTDMANYAWGTKCPPVFHDLKKKFAQYTRAE